MRSRPQGSRPAPGPRLGGGARRLAVAEPVARRGPRRRARRIGNVRGRRHGGRPNEHRPIRAGVVTESMAVASTLELAIQHEDDLVVNASAFLAQHPNGSNASFEAWPDVAHVLPRYPELQGLGFAVLVRAAELPAYVTEVMADPANQLARARRSRWSRAAIARSTASLARCLPRHHHDPGTPRVRLLLGGQLRGARRPRHGCGHVPTAGDARRQHVVHGADADLRGHGRAGDVAARRLAFIGWAGLVLDPTVVVDRAWSIAASRPSSATATRRSPAPRVAKGTVQPRGRPRQRLDGARRPARSRRRHPPQRVRRFGADGGRNRLERAARDLASCAGDRPGAGRSAGQREDRRAAPPGAARCADRVCRTGR